MTWITCSAGATYCACARRRVVEMSERQLVTSQWCRWCWWWWSIVCQSRHRCRRTHPLQLHRPYAQPSLLVRYITSTLYSAGRFTGAEPWFVPENSFKMARINGKLMNVLMRWLNCDSISLRLHSVRRYETLDTMRLKSVRLPGSVEAPTLCTKCQSVASRCSGVAGLWGALVQQ